MATDSERITALEATVQGLGTALAELAHSTLLVRSERGKEGEIHHKPCFVGTRPRYVSDESMVFIREALRPANKPRAT